MSIDKTKIKRFLLEIRRDTLEIEDFLKEGSKDKKTIKAIKYNLVEIVEATANVLQHILVKDKGYAPGGYLETLKKAKEEKIIGNSVFNKLKPFFEFRNILIHRYWATKNNLLLKEVKDNFLGFYKFIKEIEDYLNK